MSILVENLSFRYGKRLALDAINLEVLPGKVTGLLGGNGAGKSTLFRVLCGLLNPDSGTVAVNGFRLPGERSKARLSVGYVAQNFGLYDDLSVEENLRFYAKAYGLDRTCANSRTNELLDQFDLAPRRRDRAGSLSQGWKQRLAFAAALSHRPAVLLLDEVTAGLDPDSRQYAWRVIENEAQRGAAILLSTHHAEEAARCSEQFWLDQGRRQ